MDLNPSTPAFSRFAGDFAEMGSGGTFDHATGEASFPCPPKKSDYGQIQGTSDPSLQTTDLSAVTQANSADCFKPGDSANQGLKMADLMSTEWTDEKHSSHLNSIEASFVKQLYSKEYHSMDLSCWLLRRKKLLGQNSRRTNANNPFSFGQFKVLQRGSLQKLNFERTRSQLDIRNESQDLLENPWIQHFRSVSSGRGLEVTSSHGVATHSKQFPACFIHMHLQDSFGNNAEASGQNFTDDDRCEEDSSSDLCRKKKMKTMAADTSNKDQVVPFKRSQVPLNTEEKHTYMRKKDAGWSDGQLGKMNDLACSREKQADGGE